MTPPIRIEDLPPHYQAQARAKLASEKPPIGGRGSDEPKSVVRSPKSQPTPSITVHATRKPRSPNDTEQRFRDTHILNELVHYEALTFRLPGGSRYTPDWIWWKNDKLHVAEVKDKHHHPSHNRSRTAFKECAAQFPNVIFHWAHWTGSEWKIEMFNNVG